MNKNLVKKIIYGLLLVLWLGLIFYFSHQAAEVSEKVSAGVASEIVEVVETGEAAMPAEEEHWDVVADIFTPLRKFAQVFEFFILGLLVINFIKEFKLSFKEIIIGSLVASLLFSVADEFHQALVPGRAGTLTDVMIDMASVIVAIIIYAFIMKKIEEKRAKKETVKKVVEEKKEEIKKAVVEENKTTSKKTTTKNTTAKKTTTKKTPSKKETEEKKPAAKKNTTKKATTKKTTTKKRKA